MAAPRWKVLLIEDSEDDYILTRAMLLEARPAGFDFAWADDQQSALDLLASFSPDVIISDYQLGEQTGLDVLAVARTRGFRAPAILLTGHSSYQLDLQAMKAGVAEFLEKGAVTGPLLERAVRYAIERQQILDRLEQANGELAEAKAELEIRIEERNRQLQQSAAELESVEHTSLMREMMLREFLNVLPVGAWFINAEGQIVDSNPAAREIWGGPSNARMEEYGIFKGWFAATGEPVTPEKWSAYRAITRGETTLNAEVEIENLIGERRIILDSAVPLRDENGAITGVIVLNTDITDRKGAEQALADSNRLLEEAFSTIHLGTAQLDAGFHYVRVNRVYAAIDGRPPEFFIGKNHFDLYPDETNEKIFRQVVASGEPYYTFAKPFHNPGLPERGVTYWDWSLRPIKNVEGGVTGLMLSLLNVTEQQQIRAALVEAEGRLRAVVSGAPIILWSVDRGGKISLMEGRGLARLGLQPGQYVGRSMRPFLHFFPDLMEYFRRAMEGEELLAVVPLKTHPQEVFEARFSPLRDPKGEISGVTGVLTFITERVQREEQQRRAAERLEAQVELNALMAETRLDTRAMLAVLARMAAEQIGDAALVTLVDADGGALTLIAAHHPDPARNELLQQLTAGGQILFGRGLNGEAAEALSTMIAQNISKKDMHNRLTPIFWPYLEKYGMSSVIVAPMLAHDNLIGTLMIARDGQGDPYTLEDQLFLEGLADRAGLAVANARLFEAAQNELAERRRIEAELSEIQSRLMDGAEQERHTLARELHDGPIQDLYALQFQLRALIGQNPGGEQLDLDREVRSLNESIQKIIENLRSTSINLRPPALTRFGLTPVLRSMCEQYAAMQPDLHISLNLGGDGGTPEQTLSERVRVALFRIAQVTLTNVVRHASASRVEMRLWTEEGRVYFEVEDDGVGFHAPERWVELARQGHLGLVGALERVDALGGRMQVKTSPGQGTTISVSLPINA